MKGSVAKVQKVRHSPSLITNYEFGLTRGIVCCIYHRPKAVDESSDESSSDSDLSSGDEGGGDADKKGKGHKCGGPGHNHGRGRKGKSGKGDRAPSPNAYEKVPKVKPKEDAANKG